MNFNVKPNFKEVGKMFGPKIKDYTNLLQDLSREETTSLLNNNSINREFDGSNLEITPNMVDIRIEAKEGFNVGMQNNKFVILNTEISDDLYLEGLAREIVSKVQNLRKEKGFEIMDRITLYYSGDEDINKCFDTYSELIASETLATDVKMEIKGEEVDINSHKVILDVEKI